jgi:PBSX family phage portal protein
MAGEKDFNERSAGKNQAKVRALILPIKKAQQAEPGKSKTLPEDPLEAMVETGEIIEPPFDLLSLSMLSEHNTELGPAVQAMEINIEGFGQRLVGRLDAEKLKDDKVLHKKVQEEKVRLDNFFAYAALDISFTKFRRMLRVDLELTGNAYFEVVRNMKGEIQGFNHVPSYQIRLGRQQKDAVEVDMPVYQLQDKGAVVIEKMRVWKRFRTFVQAKYLYRRDLSYVGTFLKRYFKEFGDPRIYDNETGEIVNDAGKLAKLSPDRRANELVHLKIYSPRSPYGLPRFVGAMLSIYGDRASEEINYITIRHNNIPSMALMVSNGQITQGTIDRIKDFTEALIQGSDNFSKWLLLEAEPAEVEGEEPGQVKFELKPLTQVQHKDALFQEYSKNNQDKVRRQFRLPPLLIGKADDYTRTTAETSRRLADEQIFAPERDEFDNLINRVIFPHMNVLYHKFKSNSPNTTDNTELVKILAGAEKTGGMTPRIARVMLEDILGIELPPFPEDFPADRPFSETMAEAVKNMASPVEPGQQVTALKMIDQLTESDIPLFEKTEEEMVEKLLSVRNKLEQKWREEVEIE